MLDPLVPLFGGFQLNWLDDRVTTAPLWTRTDAINAMSQSPHVAVMNGHAGLVLPDPLRAGGNPIARSIEIPDLDDLTNQWPFLVYSVGCDVGRFDFFDPLLVIASARSF